MKHIGIVACSAEGAALCYQAICRESLTLVGKNDHPRVTMDSIPMARWLPSFEAGDYAGVAGFMLESARLLAAAGADFAICPDNSAHLAWEHVQAQTPIPWLHIAGVVGQEAVRRGFGRVGVLGTRYTMNGPVYREALGALGIDTVVPEGADFETVDRIIWTELVDGIFSDASRRAYNEVIARLRESGCDAVALACTEIPLLVRPAESPLPVLDSTRLLAAAAVREALAEAGPRIVDPRGVLAVRDARPAPDRPSVAGAGVRPDVTWAELKEHAEGSWRLSGPNSQGGTTLYRYKGRLFTVACGEQSSLPGGAEQVVAVRPDNTPGFPPLLEGGHAAGCCHDAHFDSDWWMHRTTLLKIHQGAVLLFQDAKELWSCSLDAFVRAGSPQRDHVLRAMGPAVLDEAVRCAARRLGL